MFFVRTRLLLHLWANTGDFGMDIWLRGTDDQNMSYLRSKCGSISSASSVGSRKFELVITIPGIAPYPEGMPLLTRHSQLVRTKIRADPQEEPL
jgi:hypothetical protein